MIILKTTLERRLWDAKMKLWRAHKGHVADQLSYRFFRYRGRKNDSNFLTVEERYALAKDWQI